MPTRRGVFAVIYGSVCSGIEAGTQAAPEGWRAAFYSEIDTFPSAVLAHHYPDVPNVGDFTTITADDWPDVELLMGGPPCQSFSIAGRRAGLDDARGNLTLSYVELAHDLATNGSLRWAVYENVPGILSDKTNAFGCLISALVGGGDPFTTIDGGSWPSAGLASGPRARLAWRVLDAQYFGLAQRRRRVILVVGFAEQCDPAKVLFERQGVQRHPPTRGEAGQGFAADVAPSLVASGRGVGRTGDTRGQDPVVAEIAHTLRGSGFDASEDGTGRGTPLVPVCTARMTAFGEYVDDGTASTVKARDYKDATDLIAFSAKDSGADASDNLAPTLRAGGHDKSHANAGVMPAVAFQCQGTNVGSEHDMTGTLGTNCGSVSGGAPAIAIRRLTPVECERLQGFPDNFTRIPWRGKAPEHCPDGPRYKALGNSWAVNKFRWLFERLDAVDRMAREESNV